VNLTTGEIFDITQKRRFFSKPIPPFMQDLIRDGGLIQHLRKEKLKRKR
jgi:3-isopropylmalate/(R)-2-methylmalate dehydratase small subunit